MASYCLCKHPRESHHTTVINGRAVPFCRECEECNGFGVIAPRPPRSMLLDAIPAGEPTEVAAGLDPAETLIYAWDAALCSSCEWRTSAPDLLARRDARCLQCNAPLVPVRVEVHEREPL